MPSADALAAVADLYERGRMIDALLRAETIAPLARWTGAKPCIIAARIAANTGAPGLATRLSFRAWHSDQRNPATLAQIGYEILGKRGPLALWRKLRTWEPAPDDSAEHIAELFALKSRAAAALRDFATADHWLERAESMAPELPWIRLQRAYLLEGQDRIEEALEIAQSAQTFHRHPYYRPGVQICAHLFQLLDRDDDAIELLELAARSLQSGPIAAQLYSLLTENERWSEAEAALQRYVELSPLLEPALEKWVTSQRARVAHRLGRRADAARFAGALNDDFHARFAERLALEPRGRERVHLNVTFVRQHFKTCAPATLASIGQFFRMPAEHVQLAEAICYDGTPTWQQRDWAEQNGWHVREFDLTFDTALALLERDVPFAISTVEANSAHMMAVIGFDRTRGTLLLRDPSQPYAVEMDAEPFLRRYRPFGPRAIVFVPLAEQARVRDVVLPKAELYDLYHTVLLALSKHDRARAASAVAAMESTAGDDRLTYEGRLELAAYDANVTEQTRCLDKLLELFPGNPARLLLRFACMRDAPRDERIGFLERACAGKDPDPALLIALARALQGDDRVRHDVRRRLERALRYRPMDSDAIQGLADFHWEQGQLDEATEYYRFAANLEGFREHLFQMWFNACRRTRRTQEALAHLTDRFDRFGTRSEQPALTLAWAYKELEQPERAREVLDAAMRLRPVDGHLLLRSGMLLASFSHGAQARALVDAAKGKVRDSDRLRARMEIAEKGHATQEVLETARELLQSEPLALDAHAAQARALARREGTSAALAALRKACEHFPRHYGLQRMVVEWSRDAGPAAVELAVRELLEVEPSDAWAHRELAVALVRLERGADALLAAEESARIEPLNSYSFSVLAFVYRRLGRVAEARAHLRRAIELSVDNGEAIGAMLDLARTDAERIEDLAFVARELVRQVVFGDGLLAYVDIARPILQAEELLAMLRDAHAQRPDLWHAWAALVAQLGHMLRLDEALETARAFTERFPHVLRSWLDLAFVHRWRNEPEGEIGAAERAFELNPVWNPATLAFAGALERRGRLEEALSVYGRALTHSPHDPQLHLFNALLLWRLRRADEALAAVERSLLLAPDNDVAWESLNEWCLQLGRPQRIVEFAQTLTDERPGEARVWLVFARALRAQEHRDKRLAAVDRAIELDRRSTTAWDLKAELCAYAERFDDAVLACEMGAAACTDEVYMLHGRRAWVEAARGRRPAAIDLMRAVLAENASYVWGWHQLGSWLLQERSFEDAKAAFSQLRKLRPHDSWVHRQIAFLELEQNERGNAKKSFAAALESTPTDVAAAHNLFDLQLADGELDGAAATLRAMQTHQPGAATTAAELMLRLRQRNHAAARQALELLCRSPDPDPWPLDAAVQALLRAAQSTLALKVLRRCVRDPEANPQVGAALVRTLLARGSCWAAARAFIGMRAGELQLRAAGPLIHGLAQAQRTSVVRWLLWRRGDVLRRNDDAWGQVGFALANAKRNRQVVRWLADWRERERVQPWMLFNYCLALRHLGQYGEAHDVARHVVDVWPHRDGAADMHLFLAVEHALAGAPVEARDHLRRVKPREDVLYDMQLVALTHALVEFEESPRSERVRRFRDVRTRLGPYFTGLRLVYSMRDARRTFKRAGERFVRDGGGLRAWLWVKWKLHWQWSLVAVVPLVLVAVIAAAIGGIGGPPSVFLVLGVVVAAALLRGDASVPPSPPPPSSSS